MRNDPFFTSATKQKATPQTEKKVEENLTSLLNEKFNEKEDRDKERYQTNQWMWMAGTIVLSMVVAIFLALHLSLGTEISELRSYHINRTHEFVRIANDLEKRIIPLENQLK